MSDLASRITKPDEPAKKVDWAESVEADEADENKQQAEAEAGAGAAEAQVDGAVEELSGSGLQEPEWDVEVSLSELQANETTPFHSATQWQDMGL
jgi:ATP-dependent RNA helicase DDX19/DBP5